MAAYIAATTAATDGADFTLATGVAATLNIVGATDATAVALLYLKDSASAYLPVPDGVISRGTPMLQVFGPGTFRVSKGLTPTAFGVDKS